MSILTLLDDLQSASYKDAGFLVNVMSTKGGRKHVIHEYPNSNIQNVEDLGLRPRSYKINAIINEPNYKFKRDNLLEKLESGGPGVLIHPTFGRIENMVAVDYTFIEDLTKAGDLTVVIDFEPSNSSGLPVETANTLSIIQERESNVFDSITDDIGELFNVTNAFTGNFRSAQDKLNQFVLAVTNNTSALTSTTGTINTFNQLISNFQSNINTYINQPLLLADGIEAIFTALPDLYEDAESQFSAQSLFFDFGDDDIDIPQNTVGRIERKSNNDVINGAVQGYAVAQAYTSSAQIPLNTTEEIETVENTLESGFQSVKLSGQLS